MTTTTAGTLARTQTRIWRMLVWGGAATLLALPAVAMRFTNEVNWTAFDFIAMGAILGSLGLAFEVVLRRSSSLAYRFGGALALGATFLLIWFNLAVGIIGSEDNPANIMFAGVITVAFAGSIMARFKPAGMARAMVAAAAAEVIVGIAAVVGDMGAGSALWPRPVIVLTSVFTCIWLGAAALFRQAARTA